MYEVWLSVLLGPKLQSGEHTGVIRGVFQQPLLAAFSCLIITVFSVQTFWVPCRGSLSHPSREKTKAVFFQDYFRLLPTSLFFGGGTHTPRGAPFSCGQQAGLDHQAGFHYRKEPADVAESCLLGWELPGIVVSPSPRDAEERGKEACSSPHLSWMDHLKLF